MAKIETAIKDAIARGARKHIRQVATPLRREVRRLRQFVRQLRQDVATLRDTAARWERAQQGRSWQPELSEAELKTARLSPRLVQKLRSRLGLSQASLARLVGVSAAAVVGWEGGRSTPAGRNRGALIALRKVGRRESKRLLAALGTVPRRRARPAKRRARRRSSRPRR